MERHVVTRWSISFTTYVHTNTKRKNFFLLLFYLLHLLQDTPGHEQEPEERRSRSPSSADTDKTAATVVTRFGVDFGLEGCCWGIEIVRPKEKVALMQNGAKRSK